jgi:hypothetical protein
VPRDGSERDSWGGGTVAASQSIEDWHKTQSARMPLDFQDIEQELFDISPKVYFQFEPIRDVLADVIL